MKVGIVLVWSLSLSWVFYLAFFIFRYTRLQTTFDDLFLISATIYKEPRPILSLLFWSRSGEIVSGRRLIALVPDSETENELMFTSSRAFLNDASDHLIVATTELPGHISDKQILLTVEEKKKKLLEDVVGRVKLRLRTREAETSRRGVVSCLAPIMDKAYPETITAISAAISFGSFVHIPHGTLQAPLFRVLVTLQKAGHARLSPWVPFNSLPNYDPNEVLGAQSRTAAFLDCFLQYRHAAQFLIFSDADDLVLPHLEPNYIEELHAVFSETTSRLVRYNVRRIGALDHDSVDETFYPSDVLEKTEFAESFGNQVRVAMVHRMHDDDELFVDYRPLDQFYSEEIVNKIVSTPVSKGALDTIDSTIDKVRLNPMFSRAWAVLAENCVLEPSTAEWKCVRDRCVNIYPRYESLYGAFYFNIHQHFKVSIVKENCLSDGNTAK